VATRRGGGSACARGTRRLLWHKATAALTHEGPAYRRRIPTSAVSLAPSGRRREHDSNLSPAVGGLDVFLADWRAARGGKLLTRHGRWLWSRRGTRIARFSFWGDPMRATIAACCLSSAFLVLAGSSTASGNPYTTFFPAPLSIPSTTEIALQGFDPGLGTLTRVWIDTLIEFEGLATFTNPTPSPLEALVTLRLVSALTGRPGYEFLEVLDEFFVVASGLMSPGQSVVVPFSRDSGNPFAGPGVALAGFITSGLVPVDFYTGELQLVDGQFLDDVSGQVTSGQATVFYEFEPVPEPATLFLFGSGLLCLAARRRRTSWPSRITAAARAASRSDATGNPR
jgi:hypothetical protein